MFHFLLWTFQIVLYNSNHLFLESLVSWYRTIASTRVKRKQLQVLFSVCVPKVKFVQISLDSICWSTAMIFKFVTSKQNLKHCVILVSGFDLSLLLLKKTLNFKKFLTFFLGERKYSLNLMTYFISKPTLLHFELKNNLIKLI